MVLTIDIGNTNIVMALFRGKRLLKTRRIPTAITMPATHYRRAIRSFAGGRRSPRIEGVIVSSVVPKATMLITQALHILYNKENIYILGKNTRVPLVNKYRRPAQVGQDRLVNAFAVLSLYKRAPVIIVDFGTAVTIDVVSAQGAYLGGVIVPGVELSIENLTRRAALLPHIPLRKPKNVLGRSTTESMLSGIFYGYASLCDGIVEKLNHELKARAFVIATGGHARLLSSYCKTIDTIDTALTLKGLNQIYKVISKNS